MLSFQSIVAPGTAAKIVASHLFVVLVLCVRNWSTSQTLSLTILCVPMSPVPDVPAKGVVFCH